VTSSGGVLTLRGAIAEHYRATRPHSNEQQGESVMTVRTPSMKRGSIWTIASLLALAMMSSAALAQPGEGRGWASDPRAEDRTYHFADTDEELPYCVFASSKISADVPAPLIISLHGLGAPPQIMCNSTAVDLAEEGGYILAAPMGYNVAGWYGSPVLRPPGGGGPGAGEQPENLAELSELLGSGALKPVIDQIFDFSDLRHALTRFGDAQHVGKIVIRMP
jgi:hypothetical protein